MVTAASGEEYTPLPGAGAPEEWGDLPPVESWQGEDARLRVDDPTETSPERLIGAYSEAMLQIRQYDDVTALELQNGFDVAVRLMELGQHERALDQLNNLGSEPSLQIPAMELILECYVHLGRFSEALHESSVGLRYAGQRPKGGIAYWRGRAAEALGDIASAREAYKLAASQTPITLDAAERLAGLS